MTRGDDGFTGTNFERPDFKRLMQDARSGVVNTIIVKDLSRFGRNYLHVGNYISEILPSIGIRFIAIGDDVDTEKGSIDYDLMFPIKNIFNEYYPADCSRKVKQAFIAKATNGEFIGSQAPYGYRKSANDKHMLEIDETTAPTVVEIFQMAAYQGYGYNKIARVLTEQKVIAPAAYQAQQSGRPFKGDPYEWNLATVYKLFENETYLGHLVSGKRRKVSFKSKRIVKQSEDKWIVVKGIFPQLIPDQLWEDAHKALASRKRESKSGFNNIFAGLIKCEHCGYALGIANSSGRDNYFMCNTYKKKGPARCTSHYILYRELYDAVLSDIQDTLKLVNDSSEEFSKMIRKKLSDDGQAELKKAEKEIEMLKAKNMELDRKFDALYEDKLNGVLSERKFKELSARCEAEQDSINERLSFLCHQFSEQITLENATDEFIEIAKQYETITSLDADLLNHLIDRIIIGERVKTPDGNKQTISIKYKFIGKIA